MAVDDSGAAYSWGNGGYGRVGHNVQKDEFSAKKLEALANRVKAAPESLVRERRLTLSRGEERVPSARSERAGFGSMLRLHVWPSRFGQTAGRRYGRLH